jgi:hypothetical protein
MNAAKMTRRTAPCSTVVRPVLGRPKNEPVLGRPKNEAASYKAIENDHHGREHGVPGDALAALGPGKHDRDNNPASITVTATARRIEPKGSPNLSASTSA